MIWHKRSKSFFPWIRLDNPENYHSESEIDYPNVLDSFTAIQVGKKNKHFICCHLLCQRSRILETEGTVFPNTDRRTVNSFYKLESFHEREK